MWILCGMVALGTKNGIQPQSSTTRPGEVLGNLTVLPCSMLESTAGLSNCGCCQREGCFKPHPAGRIVWHNSLRSGLILFWVYKLWNSGSEMSLDQVTQLSGFQITGRGSRRPVLGGPDHFFLPPPLHGVGSGGGAS